MDWKSDFIKLPFDCDFRPLSPVYSSQLDVIVEEVLDNERNNEKCKYGSLESTLFESCIQENLSQTFFEDSCVFQSPTITSVTQFEDCAASPQNSSHVKTPKTVACSYRVESDSNFIASLVERVKRWLHEFMMGIRRRLQSPKLHEDRMNFEKMALKLKELQADTDAAMLEMTKKIQQLQEDALARDCDFRKYQDVMVEELRMLKERLLANSIMEKTNVGCVPIPSVTSSPAAPPVPPPPPPPLPPPPSMAAPVIMTKKSSEQKKIQETPRISITAQDLASVRLRKVTNATVKKSYTGQTVTLEQLRSVKLRPRRKSPQAQSSPTRTPLCRERVRKIRSPNFRGNTRPRIDRIPLSKILNLDDSF